MKAGGGLVGAAGVAVVVGLVGLYDVVVGLYLLFAEAPELAFGADTSLVAMPASAGADALLRRMGAFSLHAGVVSIVWAALGWRRPAVMSALFATYLLTGMGFYWTDHSGFPGTRYLAVKGGIGAVFFGAFVVHVWGRWRGRRGEG